MDTEALYFPFINVPNTSWFSRTLLYWNSVSSIMPRNFARWPEQLQRYTQDLQRAELLRPIIPEQFVPELDRFADGFVEYIQELDDESLAQRAESDDTVWIHTGKLPDSDFKQFLRDKGLAGQFEHPWLPVECETATDYMAYLATCIAESHSGNIRAVTDDIANCSPLLAVRDQTDVKLQEIRQELLKAALPAPKEPIPVEQAQIFKKKYGSLLPDFRFWLEERIANIADSTTPEMRLKRVEDTKELITHETKKIAKTLKDNGFSDLVFGDLFSVLGAIPGVSMLPKLVNKIYGVTNVKPKSGPLAYAALAEKHLGMEHQPS